MRRFADLHLKPHIEDTDQVEKLIKKASELGYRMVAMSLPKVESLYQEAS